MGKPLRVLMVEDSKDDTLLIVRELQRDGYEVTFEQVDTPATMATALEKQTWDVVIADYVLPQFSGPNALKLLRESGLDLPFIVVSGKIGEDTAVAAMKAGAHDYIMKDNLRRLVAAVERELHEAETRRERRRAEEELRQYREHLEKMVEERTKELKDAQEQLVRQEKLAVLGQLAGGVGHELRNQLGAIKNAVYFLNMVLEQPDPEVKETLQILEKEVAASERVISSLLDFARPKPPTRRKVDINDVVREALSGASVPQNVQVVNQLDEALPTILADPDQLGQVFDNIILNAIQAMPQGGQLVLSSEAPSPRWVTVSLGDTGVGIPEENLNNIFEPLFTSKAKGIGLGLAIVKILVEGHGGTIEVRSEVGKGSTFMVRLPVNREEEK